MVQHLSVPGKLMIAGEYAVLRDDGVALAVACAELVRVHLLAVAEGALPPSHHVQAFGQSWPVHGQAAGLAGFAHAAIEAARLAWQVTPRHRLGIEVLGQHGGVKVGLGTSAAVTVATLRAVVGSAGHPQTDASVAALARAVHHQRQGGQGSGYDVTAIAHGGCIAYHRSPDRGEPLRWPAGLSGAAFFSGEPAPTQDALGRLAALGPALEGIGAAARDLLGLWPSGDGAAVLGGLQRCEDALEAAAVRVPGLVPPALRHLKSFLSSRGLVARTSGAGGGDCVLGFGAAVDVAAAACAWRAQGGVVVAQLPADLSVPTHSLPGHGASHGL